MSAFRTWLAKTMTFEGWMAINEVVDSSRIRTFTIMCAYLAFASYFVMRIAQFYFDLPSEDKRDPAVAAFCALVIAFVGNNCKQVIELYQSSGRDWAAYHRERKDPA